MKKIVDCFLFYNELDMLEYRLATLNDFVDFFVIVESAYTFTGKAKELFYDTHKDDPRFLPYRSKIMHVEVSNMPFVDQAEIKVDPWQNEKWQRDCIRLGLKQLALIDEDIIIIADVDEIADPSTLKTLKEMPQSLNDVFSLEMDLYYYNLTSRMPNLWYYTKVMTYKFYESNPQISCHDYRYVYNSKMYIKNGGWHLDYFGDTDFIKNKIENFSHQEFNKPEYTDPQQIERRILANVDIFDRPTTLTSVPIETNPYLPPLWDKFPKLMGVHHTRS